MLGNLYSFRCGTISVRRYTEEPSEYDIIIECDGIIIPSVSLFLRFAKAQLLVPTPCFRVSKPVSLLAVGFLAGVFVITLQLRMWDEKILR